PDADPLGDRHRSEPLADPQAFCLLAGTLARQPAKRQAPAKPTAVSRDGRQDLLRHCPLPGPLQISGAGRLLPPPPEHPRGPGRQHRLRPQNRHPLLQRPETRRQICRAGPGSLRKKIPRTVHQTHEKSRRTLWLNPCRTQTCVNGSLAARCRHAMRWKKSERCGWALPQPRSVGFSCLLLRPFVNLWTNNFGVAPRDRYDGDMAADYDQLLEATIQHLEDLK